MRFLSVIAVAVVALASAGLLRAHHSILAYDFEPFWVEGEVVSFEPSNPHTLTTLEAPRSDGRIQRWRVEGPPISRLNLRGSVYLPQVGDQIRFCALPYKPLEELQRLWPEVDYSDRVERMFPETDESVTTTVDGYILVQPGGDKQIWDSPAFLAQCMRLSGDAPESWLPIINSDRWCERRRPLPNEEPDPTLQTYIEEVAPLLGVSCE